MMKRMVKRPTEFYEYPAKILVKKDWDEKEKFDNTGEANFAVIDSNDKDTEYQGTVSYVRTGAVTKHMRKLLIDKIDKFKKTTKEDFEHNDPYYEMGLYDSKILEGLSFVIHKNYYSLKLLDKFVLNN